MKPKKKKPESGGRIGLGAAGIRSAQSITTNTLIMPKIAPLVKGKGREKMPPKKFTFDKKTVLDALGTSGIRAFYESETGQSLGDVNSDGEAEKIICPFHDEKTGSFSINLDTGLFQCFGCKAGGSIFDFHTRKHGGGFSDAVAALASFAGLAAPVDPESMPNRTATTPIKKDDANTTKPERDFGMAWGAASMNPLSPEALAYLEGRKIRPETVAALKELGLVGFAPQAYAGKHGGRAENVPAIAFPMYDAAGKLVGIQNEFPNHPQSLADGKAQRRRNEYRSQAKRAAYRLGHPDAGTYIITESVMKAVAAFQALPDTYAIGMFSAGMVSADTVGGIPAGKTVIGFFDNDNAGRGACQQLVTLYPGALTVTWGDDAKKGADINDLLEADPSGGSIRAKIAEAAPIVAKTPGDVLTQVPPGEFWKVEEDGSVKILEDRLYGLLAASGFHLAPLNGVPVLVHETAGVVAPCDLGHVRNHIFRDVLPKNDADGLRCAIREKMMRGIGSYIQQAKIDTLPITDIDTARDTRTETFFDFQNVTVRATAGGITVHKRGERGTVWESSVIPHKYRASVETSEFETFLRNVCTGLDGLEPDRYRAARCAIGYMLSRHNNPGYPRAVILSDGSLDDTPEGGTGKGLIAAAIGKIRKVARQDGKTGGTTDQFSLQNVLPDTNIVLFDDVKRGFDFETIFSNVSEGYTVEKKFIDRFQFEFANNPKTLITTNYAIRGAGNSHERRKYELEICPFYNGSHTPEDDFGILFGNWNEEKWDSFFNFMIECSVEFHKAGERIPEYASVTLGRKKIIGAVGAPFADFMDTLEPGKVYTIQAAFMDYKAGFLSSKACRAATENGFSRALTAWAKASGCELVRDNRRIDGIKSRCFAVEADSEPMYEAITRQSTDTEEGKRISCAQCGFRNNTYCKRYNETIGMVPFQRVQACVDDDTHQPGKGE